MSLLLAIPLLVAQAQIEESEAEVASTTEPVEETIVEETPAEKVASTTEDMVGAEVVEESETATSTSETTKMPSETSPIEESTAASSTSESVEEPTEDTASSTSEIIEDIASSSEPMLSEPIFEESPSEEPLALQTSVKMDAHYALGDTIRAQIKFKNQTCRECKRSTASTTVTAYYTPLYPNDGPDSNEIGPHFGERSFEIIEAGPWRSQTFDWSGATDASGEFYFVVIIDPENKANMHSLYRSQFSIE